MCSELSETGGISNIKLCKIGKMKTDLQVCLDALHLDLLVLLADTLVGTVTSCKWKKEEGEDNQG